MTHPKKLTTFKSISDDDDYYWNGKEWRHKFFSVPDIDENLAPKGEIVDIRAKYGGNSIAKAFGLTVEEICKQLGKKRKEVDRVSLSIAGMSPDELYMIADKLGKHNQKS